MERKGKDKKRILIWSRCFYGRVECDFWRSLSGVMGWECRHIHDYRNVNYEDQNDFDRMITEYEPDIIALAYVN